MKTLLTLLLALSAFSYTHAQERAAGSALETQMTWSVLAAKVDAAVNLTQGLDTKVSQVSICNAKGMVYAPSNPDKDSKGCVEANNTLTDNIYKCTKKSMFWNGTKCEEMDITAINKIISCNTKGLLWDGKDCVQAVKGKDCNFKKTGICTSAACQIRYMDRVSGKLVLTDVPDMWKDGEVYVWEHRQTNENFVGAQCRDGDFIRFGTGL